MRLLTLPAALLLVLACSQPAEKNPATVDRGPFDLLAAHVQRCMLLSGDCSAGAAVVMQGGKVLYEEYFGREGRRLDAAPVGPESRFPLYSVSKGFCSALVLSLVSDGVIALDDPVTKYMPYFKGTGPGGKLLREHVTIRCLASHSGGLPRDTRPPLVWADGVEPFSDVVLEYEPGAAFLYSELGMRLLGHVLELAAGKPYDQLMRERVLEPLGLSGTGWLNRGDNPVHIVETCWGPDSSYIHYSDEYAPKPYPGSGLYGTALDIARYAQLFLDRGKIGERQVFRSDLPDSAWVTQPAGRAPDPDYGLLFWLFPRQKAVVFSGMAHTICAILPEHDLLLVMCLNQARDNPGWDFEAEKQNLARVGLALDDRLKWQAGERKTGERARER